MFNLHPHPLTLQVAADFGDLGVLRRELGRWLDAAEVDPLISADTLLVATELCTNAIEASEADAPVEVEATTDGRALRLMVANERRDTAPEEIDPPDLQRGSLQERGRGLAIVRALVDSVALTAERGRTVVRTVRRL